MALRKNTAKYSTASTPSASNTSKNTSTNTGTASTSNTSTGTTKSSTTTGNNRQHTTNSNTQVVSTNTNQPAPVANVKAKSTSDSILSGLFGEPSVKNAPYAETQKSQHLVNSQSQISKSEQSVNTAQNKNFTYAQDQSGNTYTITSKLSLQQRQDLAKQGIKTNSMPYVNVGFASQIIDVSDIGFTYDQPTDIIVDANLANADLEKNIQTDIVANLQAGQCVELSKGQTICKQTVDTAEDGFTANQATEATEQSAESNNVQLGANTYGSDGATTETADERYNDGHTLTTQKDDPLIVELLAGQKSSQQWMHQVNEQIVALGNYHAFSNNGKNGNNGVYSNGNGKANGNGNGNGNGMANLEATFAKITGSKYFPIVIVGIIVLLVIGFLKPKSAGAAPSAPSKVFQFA